MDFTEKEKQKLENLYERIRARIADIRSEPSLVRFSPDTHPHIWKRLEYYESLSREELMAEIEADYALLTDC